MIKKLNILSHSYFYIGPNISNQEVVGSKPYSLIFPMYRPRRLI